MNFNTIGIICEYNPFHFGHMYHINEARRISGCENVVCIMSGSMVQRGEPAIFDKWSRARAAVENGADLVVELPAYYALQSADNFAFGSVDILDKLNIVDALCFGAETKDISLLKRAADITANPDADYNNALTQMLSSGAGYPAACEYALKSVMPEATDELFSPNNTLAIAYLSAIIKLGSKLEAFCVHRNNDYHSSQSGDNFKSATAVRQMITSGEDYGLYAPCYDKLSLYTLKNAESYILGFFRNISPNDLSHIAGCENGLENLVINSARKACTMEEFFQMCTTRRYTIHRIQRLCACAILGIKKEKLTPDYVRILAFNSVGASLIRQIKEKSSLIPVTKTADYAGSPMFDIDVASTDFAALCCDDVTKRYCGKDFLCSPWVLKN